MQGPIYTANGSVVYVNGATDHALLAPGRQLRDVSLFLHPSAGSIGVDYTGDDTPSAGGKWIPIDAGEVSAGSNIVFLGPITGIRLRPIAAGAAATYIVRA
jgi:hypothetical protein